MTLPPEKIGDRGQRYVLQARGFPKHEVPDTEWQNVAYGGNTSGMSRMADSFGLHPSVQELRLYDREEDCVVALED